MMDDLSLRVQVAFGSHWGIATQWESAKGEMDVEVDVAVDVYIAALSGCAPCLARFYLGELLLVTT